MTEVWLKLDAYTAGWLEAQMELLLDEYVTKGSTVEKHAADKAEAFKVASMAASVLVLINGAVADSTSNRSST